MKISLSTVSIFLIVMWARHAVAAAQDDTFLGAATRRSGESNAWYVGAARLKATPKWDSVRGGIPLSPDKAVQIGRDWLQAKERHHDAELVSVMLLSPQSVS